MLKALPSDAAAPSLRDRLLWVCPFAGLLAGGGVLWLFGFSFWTALAFVLLIACPSVVAWALVAERRDKPAPPPAVAAGRLQTIHLMVPGMGSDHCAGIVTTSLRRLPGVGEVGTNIANHRVTVRFDATRTAAADLRQAVEQAGYDVAAVEDKAAASPAAGEDVEERYLALAWRRFWFAAVPTTLIMLLMAVENWARVRSKSGPLWHDEELVPVVHGRAPRAARRAFSEG